MIIDLKINGREYNPNDFIDIPNYFIDDERVTNKAFRLYSILVSLKNDYKLSKIDTYLLIDKMKCSESTFHKAKKNLKELGYLKIEKIKGTNQNNWIILK